MPWDIWLIFLVLGLILPWRGRVRMKRLLAMPRVGPMERLALYASTIAFQWFAVAVVAWRTWAHGFTAAQLGLTMQGRTRILVASIFGWVLWFVVYTIYEVRIDPSGYHGSGWR